MGLSSSVVTNGCIQGSLSLCLCIVCTGYVQQTILEMPFAFVPKRVKVCFPNEFIFMQVKLIFIRHIFCRKAQPNSEMAYYKKHMYHWMRNPVVFVTFFRIFPLCLTTTRTPHPSCMRSITFSGSNAALATISSPVRITLLTFPGGVASGSCDTLSGSNKGP